MVVVPLPVVSCASAVLDSPVLWSVVAGLRGVGGGGLGGFSVALRVAAACSCVWVLLFVGVGIGSAARLEFCSLVLESLCLRIKSND